MPGFNIRVYGIVINLRNEVLVTDEFRLGHRMTKFPGGGLQYGEGTLDCLRREFREETGQEIEIIRHYYTTDFFQVSMLIPEPKQLISIYYLVSLPFPEQIITTDKPFDFEDIEGAQTFRWIPLANLTPDHMTFPIDKKVAGMLRQDFARISTQ